MEKKISLSPSLQVLLSPLCANTGTTCIIPGCMGISAPLPGALPSPPSSLTVDSAGDFSHVFSLSHSCSCTVFLNHRGTTNITSELSFDQRQGHLGVSWNWLLPPQGWQILDLLTSGSHAAPLLPKPFLVNPMHHHLRYN